MSTQSEVLNEIPPWPKEGIPIGMTDPVEKKAWRAENPLTLDGLGEIMSYNTKVSDLRFRDIWRDIDALYGPRLCQIGFVHRKPTLRERFIIWLFRLETMPLSQWMAQMGRQEPSAAQPKPASPPPVVGPRLDAD